MSDEATIRTALRRVAASVDAPEHLPWREALANRRRRRRRATWTGVAGIVAVAAAASVAIATRPEPTHRRVIVMQPVPSAPVEPAPSGGPAQTIDAATTGSSTPAVQSPLDTGATAGAPATGIPDTTVPPLNTSRWIAVEDAPFTISPGAVAGLAGGEYVVWDGSSPTEQAAAWSPARGWRAIAESPLSPRTGAMAVPAGDRLIIWGGLPVEGDEASTAPVGGGSYADGAIYDPATDTWAPIPITTATGTPRTADDGVAVWTGSELLLWASDGLGGRAAAYDPVAGTWRTTTPSPLTPRSRVAGVWTGTELIVWGGTSYDGAFTGNPDDGAAYDPTTDAWRVLPPAPMAGAVVDAAWTGSEVLFTPGYSGDPAGTVTARAGGGSYDPATDTWSAITWLGQHPGSTIVVVEQRVLIMAKGGTTVHDLADASTVELPGPVVDEADGNAVDLPNAGIDGTTVVSLGPAGDGLTGAIAVGLLSDYQTDARRLAYLPLP